MTEPSKTPRIKALMRDPLNSNDLRAWQTLAAELEGALSATQKAFDGAMELAREKELLWRESTDYAEELLGAVYSVLCESNGVDDNEWKRPDGTAIPEWPVGSFVRAIAALDAVYSRRPNRENEIGTINGATKNDSGRIGGQYADAQCRHGAAETDVQHVSPHPLHAVGTVSESVREQQRREPWSDECEAAWFKWTGTPAYAALLTATPIKDRPVGVRFAQEAFHGAYGLHSQYSADAKDAARWRWWARYWLDESDDCETINKLDYDATDPAAFNAAVDAAMAKENPESAQGKV